MLIFHSNVFNYAKLISHKCGDQPNILQQWNTGETLHMLWNIMWWLKTLALLVGTSRAEVFYHLGRFPMVKYLYSSCEEQICLARNRDYLLVFIQGCFYKYVQGAVIHLGYLCHCIINMNKKHDCGSAVIISIICVSFKNLTI